MYSPASWQAPDELTLQLASTAFSASVATGSLVWVQYRGNWVPCMGTVPWQLAPLYGYSTVATGSLVWVQYRGNWVPCMGTVRCTKMWLHNF